jgi:hypothetical protein
MAGSDFSPPLKELGSSSILPPGVSLAPTGGQGLSLDPVGQIPSYYTVASPELSYVENPNNVTVSSSTAAGANVVVTASPLLLDGQPIWVEFYASRIDTGTTQGDDVVVSLWDNGVDQGRLWHTTCGGDFLVRMGVLVRHRITPTPGIHEYSIRAWKGGNTGNGLIAGAAGGVDTVFPIHIYVYKA